MIYLNLDVNLQTCADIQTKIDKIDAIISALMDTALKSVNNGHKVEVSLDDGQSKQRIVYSTTKSITDAITAYETIRQQYVSRITGRVFRNVDGKNLNRYGC